MKIPIKILFKRMNEFDYPKMNESENEIFLSDVAMKYLTRFVVERWPLVNFFFIFSRSTGKS